MTRRGGFTFMELIVYMGLASMGLLFMGAFELSVRRTTAFQGDLLDVHAQAVRVLDQLRSEAEVADRWQVAPDSLTLIADDGSRVRYTVGRRLVLDAKGSTIHDDALSLLTGLEVEATDSGANTRRLEVRATFSRDSGDRSVSRTFRRTATLRRDDHP